ncbi:hypothetical protein [Paenibacillus xylanexedens]|uniref:hypothetical protein n=1 Tax=Paenibacillus xylanexedens TaxID=528191 RepID=UPI000FBB9984|nr:hypothetical protein [Paenibacillus xylanexedens]RPK31790.1 hypothetical protein EDO6_02417 [Paenibacillus xylanexedens]
MITKDYLNSVALDWHTYDDEKRKEVSRLLTYKYKELSESLSEMSVSEGELNEL